MNPSRPNRTRALILAALLPSAAQAQFPSGRFDAAGTAVFRPEQKLVDNEPPLGFSFAKAIDISGDTLVVGQPDITDPFVFSGRVLVYGRAGGSWVLEQTLFPSDVRPYVLFGEHVAIDGDLMLVDAPFTGRLGTPTGPGTIYAFERQDGIWVETQKIQGAVPGFGLGCALSGRRAVTRGKDGKGVFTYKRENGVWIQDQELAVSGPFSSFGGVLAMDGETVAVSSFLEFSAFIFRNTAGTWNLEARACTDLFDESNIESSFAGTLTLSGDRLVLGVPLTGSDGPGLFNSGAVAVFRRTGEVWRHEADLAPGALGVNNFFGESVQLQGNLLVVGSDFQANDLLHSGGVFAFSYGPRGWKRIAMLTAPVPQIAANFGKALALDGSRLLIAAPEEDVITALGVSGVGALYPFRVVGQLQPASRAARRP